MKSIFLIFVGFVVSLFTIGLTSCQSPKKQFTKSLTFLEITENVKHKFVDAQKNIILFDDINDDVEINLYDDEITGTIFIVTWEEEIEEVYDNEGKPTGKTTIIKRILEIEE